MVKEKIENAAAATALRLFWMRLKSYRTQTPQRIHYKCQYFVFDSRTGDTRTYIGYLCAGKGEARFSDMLFVAADGSGEIPEAARKPIELLSARPLGNRLINLRQRTAEGGGGVFRFSSRSRQEPLYYYLLDAQGKAIFAPKKLKTKAKLLLSNRCYLLTDARRSFALYLQGSENELWKLPVI